MINSPVALVTGASSGFGQITAHKLAAHGYRVFGTSRQKFYKPSNGIVMLQLDVQSDDSVKTCIEQLLNQVEQIDLLINNAGTLHVGAIEETSLEQARTVLETNFWGVVRTTNAVLPIMRQQRRGRIINVSSLAGLVGTPGEGFYSASKFALEGYSETLSLEVRPFNIHVSLIEPGFFKTNLSNTLATGDTTIPDYNALRQTIQAFIKDAIATGDDPAKVADLIVRVAKKSSPQLRYRVGQDAIWVPRMKALFPKAFRWGLRKKFNLP